MNFLIKSTVLFFIWAVFFGLVLLYARWGKPPINPTLYAKRMKLPAHKNENLFQSIMGFKKEVSLDLEKEWKKVGKIKIMKQDE